MLLAVRCLVLTGGPAGSAPGRAPGRAATAGRGAGRRGGERHDDVAGLREQGTRPGLDRRDRTCLEVFTLTFGDTDLGQQRIQAGHQVFMQAPGEAQALRGQRRTGLQGTLDVELPPLLGQRLEQPLAAADQPAAQRGRADEEDGEEGDRAGNRVARRLEQIVDHHHDQWLGKSEEKIAPGTERAERIAQHQDGEDRHHLAR